MRENNRGFTLIELVITIAIVAIVSAVAFSFAVTSSRTYQKQTKEVELQYEAQLSVNQIQELLVDARKGVGYAYNAVNSGGTDYISANMRQTDAEIMAEIDDAHPLKSKELMIFNADTCYVIQWVPQDVTTPNVVENRIYYYELKHAGGGTLTNEANRVLMAENVENFGADLTNVDKNGMVTLDVLFKKDDIEYRVTQNVRIRNKVDVNKEKSFYYHP